MKFSSAVAIFASSVFAVTTDASAIYGNQICVENKVAGDISFSVKDINTGSTVASHGNYPTSQTKCSAISSTPGSDLQLKVKAYWGTTETVNPVFDFGQGCTLQFKCAGTVDSYSCQLESYCTPQPTKAPTSNDCVDPILTDVTYSDATFAPSGFGASTTTCNNTGGAGTLSCTADFSVTQTTSETVTATSTDSVSVTGTVTFKESIEVVETTESVSVTYAGSYTEGHSKSSSESMSIKSTCSTSLQAGGCALLRGSYTVGTLQAKWQGTMTCADGSVRPGSGVLLAGNAVSQAQITDCSTSKCPVTEEFLKAVAAPQKQQRLRGAAPATVAQNVTYYDQFCVKNNMANDIHFQVYDVAGTQVASEGNYPVGQTKCVYLTSSVNPDSGMHATISTECSSCSDRHSYTPNFSYKAGAGNKLTYKCSGTEWDIACTQE